MPSLSLVVKMIQILMLLVGALVFAYGAYHLGSEALFRVRHEKVTGKIVGHETRLESRRYGGHRTEFYKVTITFPIVQYQWPPESGRLHRVVSELSTDYYGERPSASTSTFGADARTLAVGEEITVRVDASDPSNARIEMPLAAFFWPIIGFVTGLAALLLVSSMFYLHEGVFGGDVSQGISLFRGWTPRGLLVAALIAVAVIAGLKAILPETNPEERAALAKGNLERFLEMRIRREIRPPGEPLTPLEKRILALPYIGEGYATEIVRTYLHRGSVEDVRRYLVARKQGRARFSLRYPLENAARGAGGVEMLGFLITEGFGPRHPTEPEPWPLGSAIMAGDAGMLQVLLEAGADPVAKLDIIGDSPLEYALDVSPDAGVVRLLAERTPVSSLHAAAMAAAGTPAELERLLPRDKWASHLHGRLGLMHLAARFGNTEMVRALAAAGVGISRDRGGITAYQHAFRQGRRETSDLLLELGADVNERTHDGDGSTALHLAAREGDLERVRFLLAKGADPGIKNYNQLLPIDVAKGADVHEELRRAAPKR